MKNIFYSLLLFLLGFNLSAQVNNGLISEYSFSKGNASDLVGTHNGTVHGATPTTNRFGKDSTAFKFVRDSAQYIEVAYHPDFTPGVKPLSISLWFLSPLKDTIGGIIISWYRCGANPVCSAGDGAFYGIGLQDSSRVYFDARDDPGIDSSFTTKKSYNDNKWHNAILIFDPTSNFQEYYLDNIRLDSIPVNYSSLTDGGFSIPLSIGRIFRTGWGAPGNYFEGKIDDIRIYNRTLSKKDVDSLFHDGEPLGISNKAEEFSFSIFPNPTKNELTVQSNFNHPFEFIVYNLLGEELIRETIDSNSIRLDLSSLGDKIYFYKLFSDGIYLKSGKIIKE